MFVLIVNRFICSGLLVLRSLQSCTKGTAGLRRKRYERLRQCRLTRFDQGPGCSRRSLGDRRPGPQSAVRTQSAGPQPKPFQRTVMTKEESPELLGLVADYLERHGYTKASSKLKKEASASLVHAEGAVPLEAVFEAFKRRRSPSPSDDADRKQKRRKVVEESEASSTESDEDDDEDVKFMVAGKDDESDEESESSESDDEVESGEDDETDESDDSGEDDSSEDDDDSAEEEADGMFVDDEAAEGMSSESEVESEEEDSEGSSSDESDDAVLAESQSEVASSDGRLSSSSESESDSENEDGPDRAEAESSDDDSSSNDSSSDSNQQVEAADEQDASSSSDNSSSEDDDSSEEESADAGAGSLENPATVEVFACEVAAVGGDASDEEESSSESEEESSSSNDSDKEEESSSSSSEDRSSCSDGDESSEEDEGEERESEGDDKREGKARQKATPSKPKKSVSPGSADGSKSTPGQRFQRVKSNEVMYKDERLKDNTYAAIQELGETYGAKASQKLIVTRGKGFRHEKTKAKRGTYRGGKIDDSQVRSIKF